MTKELLLAGGVGAAVMYLFDPDRGRRRRAQLRDQLTSAARRAGCRANLAARDLSHRARGLVAEAHSWLSADDHPSDRVLADRVRAAIGRAVSHPHAIQVDANDGRVTLGGPILADEVPSLLDCVSAVRGVGGVEDRLEVHEEAGTLSALQGGRVPRNAPAKWSPATRMLACAVGCGLMVNCLARRTPGAALLGTAGFGLFLRALTNRELTRLTGLNRGQRWTEVHKTVTIHVPVGKAFEFWTHYANFSRFMAHVREVRDQGDGRSRWVVEGPAGVAVTWNATLIRAVPNKLLAWRAEPGSVVPNAGVIRFEQLGKEATRIDIRLAYRPPAGALGHFAAKLFGADPKSALDDDLVRLK